MKKLCVALTATIIACSLLYGCAGKERIKTEIVFDTVVTVTLYGGSAELLDGCFAMLNSYEQIFSARDESSELYKLNESHGGAASAELRKAVQEALEYCALTDGTFDITLGALTTLWNVTTRTTPPTNEEVMAALATKDYENVVVTDREIVYANSLQMLDLGAFAKGYVADRLKEYLLENGCTSALINLGGNVMCVGKKGNKPFSVGIMKPYSESSELETVLEIADNAAVTAGAYQRYFEFEGQIYHHIIDPKTGYPAENKGIDSVTVICANSALADALSTAIFINGVDYGNSIAAELGNIELHFCYSN